MSTLFKYFGNTSLPYRKIMADHTDFSIGDFVISKKRVVIAEQTHSNHVHVCREEDCGAGFDDHPQIPDCDAMVTNLTNQFLLIRTADCTPILLYDEATQSIGAVHSGREGTRKNIAGATVSTMSEHYSAQPKNIKAWIGAGICKRHYQVDETTWQKIFESFKEQNILLNFPDFPYLDIQHIILQQLRNAGLKIDNISRNIICTYESKDHFSYRRDGTRNRQINIIGMRYGKHDL